MAQTLDTREDDFTARFETLLGMKRESSSDVNDAVAAIIADVRARGDAALVELTEKFDQLDLREAGLAVTETDVAAAHSAVDDETVEALKLAHQRILDHHNRQLPASESYVDAIGVELGQRWTPVSSAGLYVPGGTASYPSSVLMNAVPAKVAGVERLVMVVPSPRGELNPLVLVAAAVAGVDEVYRVGGAQAIAALAFGTETIRPVSTIVGPGNAYVAAAKRQVFGQVGIDMVAGPSEVVVIADKENDPAWIASDLLAQAEHDTAAQSILITDDADFAEDVVAAVDAQLETLPRAETARASWENFGAVILVESLADAPALSDRLAPEHLEIATEERGRPSRENSSRRGDLRGPVYTGSHRRLRGGHQSRLADRAQRPVCVGPRRSGLHEADVAAQAQCRGSKGVRSRRHDARAIRRTRRASPFRRHKA